MVCKKKRRNYIAAFLVDNQALVLREVPELLPVCIENL